MISNNNLQHISVGLDQLMIDMTVRCMLNRNNKDFYIENLTLDKVQSMFSDMNTADLDILSIFWSAYHIAEAHYNKEKQYAEMLSHIEEIEDIYKHACPECNCVSYIKGVACPNCDYVEEV